MGEKGVGKLSRETPPPREGEPMGALTDEGGEETEVLRKIPWRQASEI